MKKQIPILFSTAMVHAKQAGRKNMTRRTSGLDDFNIDPENWQLHGLEVDKEGVLRAKFLHNSFPGVHMARCPYGKKGDILWVRETWQHWLGDTGQPTGAYIYKSDDDGSNGIGWKPSIHMPKEAARIWLEVTDVRVERLQDITEDDARREGVLLHERGIHWLNYLDQEAKVTQFIYKLHTARDSFKTLIQLLHGREIWFNNPWVWVLSFKVLSTTGKPAIL